MNAMMYTRRQPLLTLRSPGRPLSSRPVEDFERYIIADPPEPKQTWGTRVASGVILYTGVAMIIAGLAWLGFFSVVLR